MNADKRKVQYSHFTKNTIKSWQLVMENDLHKPNKKWDNKEIMGNRNKYN